MTVPTISKNHGYAQDRLEMIAMRNTDQTLQIPYLSLNSPYVVYDSVKYAKIKCFIHLFICRR